MNKTEAIAKIENLLAHFDTEEVTKEEITNTVKSAIENNVIEILLDGLQEMINQFRPS